MNILDFLWFTFKVLGVSCLILILISIFVGMFNNLINQARKAKREEEFEQLIKKAIETQNYDVSIVTDEEMKKIKKASKK